MLEGVHTLLSSMSKERRKVKDTIELHFRIGNLLTTVLCKVAENMAVNLLLDTAFIDKQIYAILPDNKNVTV